MDPIIETIQQIFERRGSESYGTECVTQLEHALQSGQLAENSGAPEALVVAALLHDIGHMLQHHDQQNRQEVNLDDQHESVAHAWLKEHFGLHIADPIRLHVVAKRYLCTKYPSYERELSPTSLKSYHDQGGRMNTEEIKHFENEPYYRDALELRKWDDLAKTPSKPTPEFDHFLPALQSCIK